MRDRINENFESLYIEQMDDRIGFQLKSQHGGWMWVRKTGMGFNAKTGDRHVTFECPETERRFWFFQEADNLHYPYVLEFFDQKAPVRHDNKWILYRTQRLDLWNSTNNEA